MVDLCMTGGIVNVGIDKFRVRHNRQFAFLVFHPGKQRDEVKLLLFVVVHTHLTPGKSLSHGAQCRIELLGAQAKPFLEHIRAEGVARGMNIAFFQKIRPVIFVKAGKKQCHHVMLSR
ncbi:Uncharacterised protein [Grimontia hollisae]|nr:Uncharacterised protein [Grimontia hollisae]